MELDAASFFHRIQGIYKKLKLTSDNHIENIEIWNLRGVGKTLTELAPIIINRMKKRDYLAVMIDPLYKVMEGDENSNGDVARMVSSFDKIAEETGAAVIYAHHFAKGSAANKSIIDRAAGAGTFARDPDAILTMTQIDWAPEIEKEKDWTAWRVESTLREFKAIQPVDMFFDWPIHRVDYDGRLADCDLLSNENNKRSQIVLHDQRSEIDEWIGRCEAVEHDGIQCFRLADLIEEINAERPKPMPRSTIDKRLREAGYRSVSRGLWAKIDESE
jgi:RecA-family ATPase